MGHVYQDKSPSRRRKSGKIRWCIEYVDEEGRRRRKKAKGQSKKLAQMELHKLETDVVRAEVAGVKSVNPKTLSAFFDDYMEHARARKAATSARRDESCRNHLLAVLGTLKMHRITPGDVERYIDKRLRASSRYGKPPASQTVRTEVMTLSAVFGQAIKRGYAQFNPCEKVDKPPASKVRIRFLTDDEEPRLLSEC